MLTIGCHLSITKGYEHIARQALSIGANTFQFFTRNPRGGKAKAIDSTDMEAFRETAAANGIKTILAHAPYTMNPASDKDKTREFARMAFADDLARMEWTPGQLYNMHPGCHVGQGIEVGAAAIVSMVNDLMSPEGTSTLLFETMAGKGTEIGGTFEELKLLIDGIDDELQPRIGVCLDTCHVWDAGYDIVNNLDETLHRFDDLIGLERIKAIHLNDSKNACGSHLDRHACIGEGHIGTDALCAVINHPSLKNLPFYLETPQDSLEGYAQEIALLKSRSIQNSID